MREDEQVISLTEGKEFFFVKFEAKFFKIRISDINWVYAKGNHSTFYMDGNKEYKIRVSLPRIINSLETSKLIQCHRNYLINYYKIDVYDPIGFVIIGNQELPISKKYKKILETKLNLLT